MLQLNKYLSGEFFLTLAAGMRPTVALCILYIKSFLQSKIVNIILSYAESIAFVFSKVESPHGKHWVMLWY